VVDGSVADRDADEAATVGRAIGSVVAEDVDVVHGAVKPSALRAGFAAASRSDLTQCRPVRRTAPSTRSNCSLAIRRAAAEWTVILGRMIAVGPRPRPRP
jgi:hypothetical protein